MAFNTFCATKNLFLNWNVLSFTSYYKIIEKFQLNIKSVNSEGYTLWYKINRGKYDDSLMCLTGRDIVNLYSIRKYFFFLIGTFC